MKRIRAAIAADRYTAFAAEFLAGPKGAASRTAEGAAEPPV